MKGSWTVLYQKLESDDVVEFGLSPTKMTHVIAENLGEAWGNSPKASEGWFISSVSFDHWIDRIQDFGGFPAVKPFGGGIVQRRLV